MESTHHHTPVPVLHINILQSTPLQHPHLTLKPPVPVQGHRHPALALTPTQVPDICLILDPTDPTPRNPVDERCVPRDMLI